MRAPLPDPPCIHLTEPEQISPDEAQASIAKFLQRSESRPYMHPDSFLVNTGIRFAMGSGPRGGIAFHHLRRVEAGLRGEVLEQETPEQLEAMFGDQYQAPGDDDMLDGLIDKSEKRLQKEGNRRKRKREEVEEWISSSSSQAIVEQPNEGQYEERLHYSKHHNEIQKSANKGSASTGLR